MIFFFVDYCCFGDEEKFGIFVFCFLFVIFVVVVGFGREANFGMVAFVLFVYEVFGVKGVSLRTV